jgi:threonyl-tRNA synthetase
MEEKLLKIRHSLAHVLAGAVLEHDGTAKFGTGPATENGFYYDMELENPISIEDLPKLEEIMREILKEGFSPELHEISYEDAKQRFKDQPYKLELIEKINDAGEKITTYTIGTFTDLCEGPHVDSSKDIDPDSFMLSNVAGAYWQGDENNQMLTRVYGIAFESKEDLEKYKDQQEEAKKRDHRKIGKELDLFAFSPLVGSGLPLFTPKGNIMRKELEEFVWELMKPYGYERVNIPHMAKCDLYKTSGHYDKFADDIFFVKSKKTSDEFIMKPMNCPHHTQIFASQPRSYKDLPVRYSEVTTVYRDENTGQLAGLTRVRSITQDDAHVFCTEDQVKDEVLAIYDIITKYYEAFNMPLRIRLSTNDPETPDKYLGDEKLWEGSINTLKECIDAVGKEYELGVGEAAFYGPKIDFIATDAIGRDWQLATAQLDFNLPERFELEYTDKDGSKKRPVMIHRAISGSLERFLGVAIEHFAGKFPLWLSPVQVGIVPVAEAHHEKAEELKQKLDAAGLRAEINKEDTSLGKRLYAFKGQFVPYMIVLGDKEVESNEITLEHRDLGKLDPLSIDAAVEKLQEEKQQRLLEPKE